MEYIEQQQKELINGMPANFHCHKQKIRTAGLVYPAHYHSYIEVLYMTNAHIEIILNNTCLQLDPGDLVVINANEVHQISSDNVGGNYAVLRFEPEVIYNSMFDNYEDSKYVMPFLLGSPVREKVVRSAEVLPTFLPAAFEELLAEFEQKRYGYELAMKVQIERIFLWTLRYFHAAGEVIPDRTLLQSDAARHLLPCLHHVSLHYDEELTAVGMAHLCHMSTSYFSRSFHRLMQLTFHEYLNYIRVQAAQKLLLSSDQNITEVAAAVGFNSTSYFIKTFKGLQHISPKQYRMQFERQ